MGRKARGAEGGDGTGGSRALRLVLSIKGNDIQLVSLRRLAMRTPPSDPFPAAKGLAGFWLEVKDASDRTLYRRVIHDPLGTTVEIRANDKEHPLGRLDVGDPSGELVLLLPDVDGARDLVLYGSPSAPAAGLEAREMARFDIARGSGGKEAT